jgi:hypothetical protein
MKAGVARAPSMGWAAPRLRGRAAAHRGPAVGCQRLQAHEQSLQRRGDRVALSLVEWFKRGPVGGDHRPQRLLVELLFALGESDQHGSPVAGIRRARDEPSPLETIEPPVTAPELTAMTARAAWDGALVVRASTQRVEDAKHRSCARTARARRRRSRARDNPAHNSSSPTTLEWPGCHARIAPRPRLGHAWDVTTLASLSALGGNGEPVPRTGPDQDVSAPPSPSAI